MDALQVEHRNLDLNNRAINLSDLPQINSQKVITIIRHRMAVQKALEMIEAKMTDPPTLNELSSFSGMSRTYFSYVFREVKGMRLQDYLIQARLNKAKNLLGNIDLKIKQIAYETGFRDPNYFCRTFKKKTGLNPTNWRLKKLENLQKGG
ncbi:MAG: helix-turn-helix transcriptional regulator [Syntrophaceae bacterium]|nr:helix-turn-helix transcriptional regulator [Syntrophaceae bacterium]